VRYQSILIVIWKKQSK